MVRFLPLATSILPLVYVSGLLYPYVTPKTLLLRVLGVVACVVFLYCVAEGKALYYSRLRHPFMLALGAFTGVAFLTSLIGTDFYRSFWSSFDRGDGLFTLFSIVSLVVLFVVTAERNALERIARISLWVGNLVAIFALLQWVQGVAGVDLPFITDARGRIGGTFGNAAFLASYLGLTLILSFLSRERLAVLASSVALQAAAVVVSGTRGTFLGLVAAAGVAALYFAFRGEGRRRFVGRLSLGALVAAVLLVSVFRTELSQAPFEPLRRVANISFTEGTGASRVFLWQHMGARAVTAPFGVGAEHIAVLFNAIYDPTLIDEEWFDRSHNAYLDALVQYGYLGFLAYGSLIGTFVLMVWRRRDDERAVILAAFVTVYAVQNFFVFDTALSLWLFCVVGASVVALGSEKASVIRLSLSHSLRFAPLALLPVIVPGVVWPLQANRLLVEGYLYQVADVPRALERMKEGLRLNSYADLEYGYQIYDMYVHTQHPQLSGELRAAAFTHARDTLHANFNRYPYDGRTAVYFAHVLDLTPPEVARDDALLTEAIDRAIVISPKRLQPWYLRANMSLRDGDAARTASEKHQSYKEGIDVLEKYLELVPNNAEPYFIIANLYLSMGDRHIAGQWAAAGERHYKNDSAIALRAAKFFLNTEDWLRAAHYLEDAVRDETAAPGLTYDLAKARFLSGDVAGARVIVSELQVTHPGLVESDPAFMDALTSAP